MTGIGQLCAQQLGWAGAGLGWAGLGLTWEPLAVVVRPRSVRDHASVHMRNICDRALPFFYCSAPSRAPPSPRPRYRGRRYQRKKGGNPRPSFVPTGRNLIGRDRELLALPVSPSLAGAGQGGGGGAGRLEGVAAPLGLTPLRHTHSSVCDRRLTAESGP